VYGARREIELLAAGHAGERGAMIGTMGSVAGADAAVGGAAGPGAGSVVARPRLFGRLAARAWVSVLSAPPGGGKTVFVGRGESDEFFRRQPEELMQHLTVPVTLASFTDAEGAGAHCQVGAQRLLCARMLDWLNWLDKTLGTPAQLAEASVEKR
jgi:hypothetical protein